MNPTIVSFDIKRIVSVTTDTSLNKVVKTAPKTIVCCYLNKTDEEIHEQLNGYDPNYLLQVLIRIVGEIDCNWNPFNNDQVRHKITAVYFNVMDQRYTEIFYDKTDFEIHEYLESRKFQSYVITGVVHGTNFKFDALNSITKFKETN